MRLFLDANIIYSAAKSDSGASSAIFLIKYKFKFSLITSKLALTESERNIAEKETPHVLNRFYELIKDLDTISVNSNKAKQFYRDIIEEKDAPILFGAKHSKADYLITLDKKHFLTKKMLKQKFSFEIITPGDFILKLKPDFRKLVP